MQGRTDRPNSRSAHAETLSFLRTHDQSDPAANVPSNDNRRGTWKRVAIHVAWRTTRSTFYLFTRHVGIFDFAQPCSIDGYRQYPAKAARMTLGKPSHLNCRVGLSDHLESRLTKWRDSSYEYNAGRLARETDMGTRRKRVLSAGSWPC